MQQVRDYRSLRLLQNGSESTIVQKSGFTFLSGNKYTSKSACCKPACVAFGITEDSL